MHDTGDKDLGQRCLRSMTVRKLTTDLLFPVKLERMKLGKRNCQHPHVFDDRDCGYDDIRAMSTSMPGECTYRLPSQENLC